MSLKLIKEATLLSVLSKDEIQALSSMKTGASLTEAADEKTELWTASSGNYDVHHPERHKSIGYFKTRGEAETALDKSNNKKMMGAIHKVAGYASWLNKKINESFTPTSNDFETWLRVIVGEAGDRGVNIGKKSDFVEIALDVLENDPAAPPLEMQEMIAKRLWQDYNSAKDTVRIGKVAQAKEEEEKVAHARKQIASRYAKGPAKTRPSYDEEESGDTWGYSSNGVDVRLGDREYAERHCREIGKNCIKLPALTKAQHADRHRSSGQENRMLGQYEEEQMGISDDLAARKIFNKIQGTPNLNFAVVQQYVNKYISMVGKSPTDVKYISALVYSMVQDAGMEEEESGFEQVMRSAAGMEEEEEPSFVRAALRDTPSTSMKGSFSSHLRGEDEDFGDDGTDMEISFGPEEAEGGDDDEVFTSGEDEDFGDDDDDDCNCSCDDATDADLDTTDEFDDGEVDSDSPDDEFDDVDEEGADEEDLVPKKGFDEEEAVKSFFRQAVTSPNDMMRQAVKDIEGEGLAAWKKANVPTNPHPKKSQAHRAWQKGLMNAAKEALGIVDKPTTPKPKPKRKK